MTRTATSLAAGAAAGAGLYLALEGGCRLPRLPRRDERGLLALVTTGAALEELVWRGPAFSLVRARIGAINAVAATSAAFALWHCPAGLGNAVRLGAAGTVFATAAMLGGRSAAVAAHVAYDLLVVLHAEPGR